VRGGDGLEIGSGGSIQYPPFISKVANYTVTANDAGSTFVAGAADLVFTLPAPSAGLRYRFICGTLSATTGLSVSPGAADKIIGNGFTAVDDKDAINTAATDRLGDMLEVESDGSDWYITGVIGTWARQA